jgi:GTP-binding protein YchF
MKGDKTLAGELALFERIYSVLEEGKCARTMALTEDEMACLYDTPLLTMKPVIYVANVSEDDAGAEPLDNAAYMALKEFAASENSAVIAVCAGIESEIAELDGEEKEMFLADMGIEESGLDKLIKASYSLLGLISYLTAGEKEVRAWTIERGTKAPQAAGKIHTDFEKGFIRAEIVDYDVLVELGSFNAAKEKGKVRSEGKDYVVKDGDVVLFRFNV